jgi:hypothetical protein
MKIRSSRGKNKIRRNGLEKKKGDVIKRYVIWDTETEFDFKDISVKKFNRTGREIRKK